MKKLYYALILLVLGCNARQPNREAHPELASDTLPVAVVEETIEATPPPVEEKAPDYDTLEWTDLHDLEPGIQIDMKYATEENFVKAKMYECSRCFLRPKVAVAVQAAHRDLQKQGLGLKMLDCFRPRPIQWKLWEKVPDPRYVSDPRKGSMHNRGAAVDLTLVDESGREFDMGTPFDFFGREAWPSYTELPDSILDRRKLLTATMEGHGFRGISTEWWHFYYLGESYELSDMLWKCY